LTACEKSVAVVAQRLHEFYHPSVASRVHLRFKIEEENLGSSTDKPFSLPWLRFGLLGFPCG